MPFEIPGALVNFLPLYWPDENGQPLEGGKIQFYATGTTTPKDTYAQADRDPGSVNTNPVILGANGRPQTPLGAPNGAIFLTSGAYDAVVYDADDVELYSIEGFEDIGLTFFSSLGTITGTGASDVTNGYIILETDNFVTCDSSSGAMDVMLPSAQDRSSVDNGNGLALTIKNMGSGVVTIAPDGADTIDGVSGGLDLPAAASPIFPSVVLLSDGISNWKVQASHGMWL